MTAPTAPAPAKRTYNLGPVLPHVKAAAQEVGDRFSIETIGGWRATARDMTGHPAGRALDIMVSGARGALVNNYLIGQRKRLGLAYTLYQQTEYSDDAGWTTGRKMEDRGDPTQNHMDHVHAQFKLLSLGDRLVDGQRQAGDVVLDAAGNVIGAAGDVAGALLPDWFGGASELLLKGVGVATAAALIVLGVRQAVTKEG